MLDKPCNYRLVNYLKKKGDLFTSTWNLAHCVSPNHHMDKRMAVNTRFQGLTELMLQIKLYIYTCKVI